MAAIVAGGVICQALADQIDALANVTATRAATRLPEADHGRHGRRRQECRIMITQHRQRTVG